VLVDLPRECSKYYSFWNPGLLENFYLKISWLQVLV
jgi:hypothetical protein